MITYCNKSDLQNAYGKIEDFHRLETLTDWTSSGDNYIKRGTGTVSLVTEDEVDLTEKTSTTLSVGEWYYDGTNDILYIRCADDGVPSTHTIKFQSITWDDLTDYAIGWASGHLESMITRGGFQRPIPKSSLSFDFNSTGWDADIVNSCAKLACVKIIRRNEPESELADKLYNDVWNDEEQSGIIWNYINGNFRFTFEPTKQDFIGQLIPISESTSGRVYLTGYGHASQNYILRVKVTTAGDVETAKFDVSSDDGQSYDTTDVYTQYYYQRLIDSLYIRFEGTFAENDEWQIKIRPDVEENRASVGNITISRN